MLETLIIVNLIMVLLLLFLNQNINSLRKARYYNIKDDVRTLTFNEEELIIEAVNSIYLDEINFQKLKENENFNGIDFKYIYSSDESLWIENNDETIYLIHQIGNKKKYRELYFELVDNKSKILFKPSTYESIYVSDGS